MAVYEIPTAAQPQTMTVQLPNEQTYNLRLLYVFAPNDCWELDVNDALGNPIVCGIPLVTGADLFAQYGYLGFGCALYCSTDGDPLAKPRFYNLGTTAHLYVEG